jgi:hypothetical protein
VCKLDKDLAPVMVVVATLPFIKALLVFVNLSGVELKLLLRFLRNEPNHPVLPANSTGDVIVMAKLIDMYTHTHTPNTPNKKQTRTTEAITN